MLSAPCRSSIISRLDTLSVRLLGPSILRAPAFNTTRAFSTTAPSLSKPLPPRRIILDSEIIENFLKGSGPGGQKINKTSSAVQLIHKPTGIVVKYQDTRSRELNRKRARRILQDRLEELEQGDDARTRVKAREKSKKKASSGKKSRRKYRALEEGKEGEGEGEGVEEGALEEEGAIGGEGAMEETQGGTVQEVEGGAVARSDSVQMEGGNKSASG